MAISLHVPTQINQCQQALSHADEKRYIFLGTSLSVYSRAFVFEDSLACVRARHRQNNEKHII